MRMMRLVLVTLAALLLAQRLGRCDHGQEAHRGPRASAGDLEDRW